MRLTYGDFSFSGEFIDLVELTKFSKEIRKFLDADKGYALDNGKSYTLDSFETWGDDDESPR